MTMPLLPDAIMRQIADAIPENIRGDIIIIDGPGKAITRDGHLRTRGNATGWTYSPTNSAPASPPKCANGRR